MLRLAGVALISLSVAACHPFAAVLCEACEGGGCGAGLECLEGVCVPPELPEQCASYVPPILGCGEAPACADGLECFEDRCIGPADVKVGATHACARWASGKVSCWGYNRQGQAGSTYVPLLQTVTVPGLDDVVDLDLGFAHSCALRQNGEVYCWGEDTVGQLGTLYDADFPEDFFNNNPTPQRISLDQPIAVLGMGNASSCAVTIAGDLYCWGRSTDYGKTEGCLLGDTSPEPSPVPLLVAEQFPFTRIACGHAHCVGLLDGRAYGWGYGQGYTSTADIFDHSGVPLCAPTDLGLEDVRDVASGWYHVCYQIGDRHISCRGDDRFAQLGGTEIDFDAPIIRLDAEGQWTCVQTDSGEVTCWGSDDEGQIGTWDYLAAPTGAPPTRVPGVDGAKRLDLGTIHACFTREDEGVFCWGTDHDNRLGQGHPTVVRPGLSLPGVHRAVSAGATHSCAIDEIGQVRCWGENVYGQLGLGIVSKNEAPRVIEGLRATQISAAYAHACALDEEGQVWCWGRNHLGQTSGSDSIVSAPRHVQGLPPIVEVSARWEHSCARAVDGTVYCWGDNRFGAANPSQTGVWEIRTPVAIPSTLGSRDLDAGADHACVLRDRQLRCWGRVPSHALITDVPEDAVKVIAGSGHDCIINGSEELWCFGSNEQGQLGTGNTRASSTLARVVELDRVIDASSVFLHACAIETSGQLKCWGQDFDEGRLGQGPEPGSRPVPVVVPLQSARSVSAGRSSTCAIALSGEVWCWGRDIWGMVSGRPTVSLAPIPVQGLHGGPQTSAPE